MAYCFREHVGFPVDDQERDESEIKRLCALIITETDREKLEELIQQLNIALARKETRRLEAILEGILHPKGKPA